MSIASRILKTFEPYIDAMITRRIVTFHDGLVRDGVIPFVQPGCGKPLASPPQSPLVPRPWVQPARKAE